jgi:5-methylcytosine-specific restriction endonuclease McrA
MSQGRRRSPLPPGWESTRRRILARDPLCRACGHAPATEVDHLGHHDDHRDHMLQGLCSPCHASKTGKDAAAAKPSRYRPPSRHPGILEPGE